MPRDILTTNAKVKTMPKTIEQYQEFLENMLDDMQTCPDDIDFYAAAIRIFLKVDE